MLIRVLDYLPKTFRLNADRRIRRFKEGFELLESGLLVRKHQNVLAVLGTPEGLQLIPAHNIVTSAGDNYYASKSVGGAATAFNTLTLGTGKTTTWAKTGSASQWGNLTGAIVATEQTVDATYPLVSDPDPNNAANAGPNVVTWRWSYTKASFSSATNITDGVITPTSPVSGTSALAGFSFTSPFTKTVDDTLAVSVSHALLGS